MSTGNTKRAKLNVKYVDGTVTGEGSYSRTDGGTPQLFLNVETPEDGLKTVILYMSEGAMPYTQDKLVSLGYNGKGDVRPQVAGKPCRLCIWQEEYEGKLQDRCDFVNPNRTGLKPKNPATASDEAQMIAMLESGVAQNAAFPPADPSPAAKTPGFKL